MVFCFLYFAFRALLGALVRSRRGLDVKDIELLVLRHEHRDRLGHVAGHELELFAAFFAEQIEELLDRLAVAAGGGSVRGSV